MTAHHSLEIRAFKPAFLATAIAFAVMPALPAAAQEEGSSAQTAQAERTFTFNIPSKPLPQAIADFSAVTGIQVLYTNQSLPDLTASAVQGTYSVDQALRQLFSNSGVTYRFTGENSVTVEQTAPAHDGPVALPPIMVQGWSSSATRGYRPDSINSATKTDSFIVDTPVAVSVVTADVIEDQNATSVGEALRNAPGVESGPNFANVSVQEEFTVRGFENSFVNVNGIERRSTGPLSVANIESIEVIKGPSSLLTGQVAPGGFINIQTKRPEEEAVYEVTGGLSHTTEGDGTMGRLTVDATGPVAGNNSILYRFIASADGGDSFIDDVDEEQYLINPMFSFFGADGDLRVDLDLSYLRNDETFRFPIPFRNGKPDSRIGRTTFLATPDNEKVTEDYSAEVRMEYRLTPNTQIDAAVGYHLNEHLTRAQRPFADSEVQPDDTFASSLDNLDQESEDIEIQANLIHNIDAGRTSWRLLAGADYRQSEFRDNELFFGGEPRINVLNPGKEARLPQRDDPDLFTLPSGKNTVDTFGLYTQAEVWIDDRLKLLGGLRYEDVEFEAGRFGNSSKQDDEEVSPRVAALYRLTMDTSVYASYSESFQQLSGSNDLGEPFEPTEAEQWEAGIKQEWFDGNLLATASVFTITQSNLAVEDPDIGSRVGQAQIGEVDTEGFELEVTGQVTDRLRLTSGYSYLDNEINNDPLGNEGNRRANVPSHKASAFAMYEVLKSQCERLSIGGGAFYTDERFVSEDNVAELDEYITVDLTAQYSVAVNNTDVTVRGGVKNLFDEDYFVQGFRNGAFRGDPRTLFTNVSVRF